MNFKLADLFRRFENLIREGSISAADYQANLYRVKTGDIETGWLRCLTLRAGNDKAWHPVSVGENVLVLSPSGDLANGIILPSLFTGNNKAPSNNPAVRLFEFADGAVIEYDSATHKLSAVLPSGATTELISTGGLKIIGDVEIIGNTHISGDTTIAGGVVADKDIVSGSISLQQHLHAGDSGGSTGQPI